MQIVLKPEQEKFIYEKLQGGKYPNVDALMLLAFHLLEEHEYKEQELLELRKKINDGAEQIKQGKMVDGSGVLKVVEIIYWK